MNRLFVVQQSSPLSWNSIFCLIFYFVFCCALIDSFVILKWVIPPFVPKWLDCNKIFHNEKVLLRKRSGSSLSVIFDMKCVVRQWNIFLCINYWACDLILDLWRLFECLSTKMVKDKLDLSVGKISSDTTDSATSGENELKMLVSTLRVFHKSLSRIKLSFEINLSCRFQRFKSQFVTSSKNDFGNHAGQPPFFSFPLQTIFYGSCNVLFIWSEIHYSSLASYTCFLLCYRTFCLHRFINVVFRTLNLQFMC